MLRRQAHEHIDRFWKTVPAHLRSAARNGVYYWLRRHTGLPRRECHISMFDMGMCEAVIQVCREAEIGLIEGPRIPNSYRPGKKNKIYEKNRRRSYK